MPLGDWVTPSTSHRKRATPCPHQGLSATRAFHLKPTRPRPAPCPPPGPLPFHVPSPRGAPPPSLIPCTAALLGMVRRIRGCGARASWHSSPSALCRLLNIYLGGVRGGNAADLINSSTSGSHSERRQEGRGPAIRDPAPAQLEGQRISPVPPGQGPGVLGSVLGGPAGKRPTVPSSPLPDPTPARKEEAQVKERRWGAAAPISGGRGGRG